MKKHDLQPSDNNIRSTFYNDSIGRNKDLVNFIKIIDSINESYSIALDSYWGSGKTFFVKQVKMILDTVTEKSYTKVDGETAILSKWIQISSNMQLKKHVPIYYDAWQNDCDEDPIYSLIYQMTLDTENIKGLKDKINFSDALNVAGKITGIVASKLSEHLAGVNPNEIVEDLRKDDFLETLRARKDIDKRIEEYIGKLLPEGCDRLLIIIDELDRCNPEFAVKLLERIKHYFNNDRITFVFAVNLAELQITIRKYYGNEFNASRYLDRFFDLRVTLPSPDMDKFYSSIGLGRNFGNIDSLDQIVRIVFRKYSMQMRDCIKYISLMKTINFEEFIANGYSADRRLYSEIIIYKVILPVVWGGMINDAYLFNRFMSGNDCTLLTAFYNDRVTLETARNSLVYLYGEETIRAKKHHDFSSQDGIKVLQKHLDDFYVALMAQHDEMDVGTCLITDRERDIFRRTVSLLADNTMLDDK